MLFIAPLVLVIIGFLFGERKEIEIDTPVVIVSVVSIISNRDRFLMVGWVNKGCSTMISFEIPYDIYRRTRDNIDGMGKDLFSLTPNITLTYKEERCLIILTDIVLINATIKELSTLETTYSYCNNWNVTNKIAVGDTRQCSDNECWKEMLTR